MFGVDRHGNRSTLLLHPDRRLGSKAECRRNGIYRRIGVKESGKETDIA